MAAAAADVRREDRQAGREAACARDQYTSETRADEGEGRKEVLVSSQKSGASQSSSLRTRDTSVSQGRPRQEPHAAVAVTAAAAAVRS